MRTPVAMIALAALAACMRTGEPPAPPARTPGSLALAAPSPSIYQPQPQRSNAENASPANESTERPSVPASPTPARDHAIGGPPVLTFLTSGGRVTIRVEIADTDAERELGLMGKTSLAPERGMVFLYDEPAERSFWMKDTLIPLSIAFWDERGRIVTILDMDPCPDGVCPTYESGVPVVGAVEVNQGYFDKHGITEGDRVRLRR